MKKIFWFVFAVSGWILAAWLYNAPASPVLYQKEQFASFTDAMLNREGIPAHVIRWDKGVYARLETGTEVVHANYGPVSKMFDPSRSWCYEEVILYQDRISENYCPSFGMYSGRSIAHFYDLPSTVQDVVLQGRRLAKEKWGL